MYILGIKTCILTIPAELTAPLEDAGSISEFKSNRALFWDTFTCSFYIFSIKQWLRLPCSMKHYEIPGSPIKLIMIYF